MRAPARLGLYAAGLAAAFVGALALGSALVPKDVVEAWTDTAHSASPHAAGSADDAHVALGTLSTQGVYRLEITATPDALNTEATLATRIVTREGTPVTAFETAHEKDLHLIVVRTDGEEFRHVHPEMDPEGTWSLPWSWSAAGTYRVYADFVPAGSAETVTVSAFVEVAGEYDPRSPEPVRTTTTADGLSITVHGDLIAGSASELSFEVTRDGEPVTVLEPYLGSFGHLVMLRSSDLAYLHAHPDAEPPSPGESSGPTVTFHATAPSAGRYLLYVDFVVDGSVHSASFVLDAEAPHYSDPSDTGEHDTNENDTNEHDTEDGGEHEH